MDTDGHPDKEARERLARFLKTLDDMAKGAKLGAQFTENLLQLLSDPKNGLIVAIDELASEIRGMRAEAAALREELRAMDKIGGLFNSILRRR